MIKTHAILYMWKKRVPITQCHYIHSWSTRLTLWLHLLPIHHPSQVKKYSPPLPTLINTCGWIELTERKEIDNSSSSFWNHNSNNMLKICSNQECQFALMANSFVFAHFFYNLKCWVDSVISMYNYCVWWPMAIAIYYCIKCKTILSVEIAIKKSFPFSCQLVTVAYWWTIWKSNSSSIHSH